MLVHKGGTLILNNDNNKRNNFLEFLQKSTTNLAFISLPDSKTVVFTVYIKSLHAGYFF